MFLISHPAFAAPQASLPEVKTYDQLVHAIRESRAASQKRVEQAVDQEKVREAWETGKLIDAHVLQHKARADYGKQVLERLAKDLEASQSELSFNLQFARAYPIYWPANKLSWSHYQALLSINDPKEREEVTKEAEEKHWTRDQLRDEVRRRQSKKIPAPEKLKAAPGKPGTYRLVKAVEGPYKGQLALDLGFSNYYRSETLGRFSEGDILQMISSKSTAEASEQTLKQVKSSAAADLFTYQAYVLKVIDGDTFDAVVDLGFGFTTVQKLRLRALDAPEVLSSEGREAKAFLEKAVKKAGGTVLIKTVKSDKYDRYLTDLWAGGLYVNQALLDEAFAVRVEPEGQP